MLHKEQLFVVPNEVKSTHEAGLPDKFALIEPEETTYLHTFLREQVGRMQEVDAHFQLLETYINNPNARVAVSWYGQSSYAEGISAMVAGVFNEHAPDVLQITHLVANRDRQGKGTRIREILNFLAKEANAKSISLACEEKDKEFFSGLLPHSVVIQFKEKKATSYIFSSKVERL